MSSLGVNPIKIDLQKRERRRVARHKIHLPAYATQTGSVDMPAFDFSQILDISEDGMAIQTSLPLRPGQSQVFSLDLPQSPELHATAGVVWADSSQRVGVRFNELSESVLMALRAWIANNEMAEGRDETQVSESPAIDADRAIADRVIYQELDAPTHPDYTLVLAGLEAVKREVEAQGANLHSALRLIADRALTFTRATGAALALTEGVDMVCLASSGNDAPPVGAHLRVGAGFSGECVRTGSLLRCDDSETDRRVDAAKARTLGIRSMLAVPVRWDSSIIGLIEVFSSEPHAFGADDELVLPRLAAFAASAVHRAGSPEEVSTKVPVVDDEFPSESPADLPLPQLAPSRNILLIASGITLLFVIYWLAGNWDHGIRRRSSSAPPPSASSQANAPEDVGSTHSVPDLRRMAELGDAVAQFALGAHYATGDDVPQDYAEAVRWFNQAAEQGNVPAQATLGAYYWAGRGVSQDLVKAYYWSILAEAGGDEASRSRVALLASRLNRSQILTAQQQANDFLSAHQTPAKDPSTAQ
jgi:putative methionine-R-sulfoxide reductase with GAF domain